MGNPGPTRDQLNKMLQIAVRVPDHGKLVPWRFVLFEGLHRAVIGQHFARQWAQLHPDHGIESQVFQAKLFERAPTVVVVISTAAEHAKIPVWEQQMSSGAVCYNMVLAAGALGLDAQWQTDWVAYDNVATKAMGLQNGERVAGIIYIGTSTVPLEDRPRPDAQTLLMVWGES